MSLTKILYLKNMIHSEDDLKRLLEYKKDKSMKIPYDIVRRISNFKAFNLINYKNLFFDDRYEKYKDFKKEILTFFSEKFQLLSKKKLIPFDEKNNGLLVPKERTEEEEVKLHELMNRKGKTHTVEKENTTGEKKRKTLKDFMKKKKVNEEKKEENKRNRETIKLGAVNSENKRMTFVYMDNMRRSPFFKWAVKSDNIFSYEKIDLVPDYDFCSSDIDEYISGETLDSGEDSSDYISDFSDFLEEKYTDMKRESVLVPFLNVFDIEMEILSEENIEKWIKLPLLKSKVVPEECIEEIRSALKNNITHKKIAEDISKKHNVVFEKALAKIKEINKNF